MTLENSDIGMGQTPKYGGYKPIIGISTLPSCWFYKWRANVRQWPIRTS